MHSSLYSIYVKYFIHKEGKKIVKPDITTFVKDYKYTLTVEKDKFAMKGKLLLFQNICGKMYENC